MGPCHQAYHYVLKQENSIKCVRDYRWDSKPIPSNTMNIGQQEGEDWWTCHRRSWMLLQANRKWRSHRSEKAGHSFQRCKRHVNPPASHCQPQVCLSMQTTSGNISVTNERRWDYAALSSSLPIYNCVILGKKVQFSRSRSPVKMEHRTPVVKSDAWLWILAPAFLSHGSPVRSDFLNLSSLMCEMGVITVSTSQGDCEN